jgi:alkanesulfonate monooxygenase SsuD/methylene tetrahydromethanopterin reductase-like flavin-dependent oxidoreductase (luciferase family)
MASRVTERALLGPVLTVPNIRHPLVLANTFSTLQKISGGRAFVGMGVGDFARIELGQRPATRQELIEYAVAVRSLTAGETVEIEGKAVSIRWSAGAVPILLGADGPRSLEGAAAVADGIIVGQGAHPDIVGHVRSHLDRGGAAVGRNCDDLDVWYSCRIYVTDRENGAIYVDGLDEYGARMARYFWRTAGGPSAENAVEQIYRRKGIRLPDEIAVALARYNDEFNTWESYNRGSKFNVELLDKYSIRDWAGRMFYVSGPADHVLERMRTLMAAGARNFLVPELLEDRFEAAERVGDVFRQLRSEFAAST